MNEDNGRLGTPVDAARCPDCGGIRFNEGGGSTQVQHSAEKFSVHCTFCGRTYHLYRSVIQGVQALDMDDPVRLPRATRANH